jgi:hypothetical protein
LEKVPESRFRDDPPGNDPLQFIFGDLLARFTREEERIVATLSYPTEPIPVTATAEISGVDEPTTRRALKLHINRSMRRMNSTGDSTASASCYFCHARIRWE